MTFSKFAYLKSLHRVEMPDSHYRVIVTLLDHAHADGTNAYPGNELLAAECCCSVDTVKRALKWATNHNLITMVKQGRRNSGATEWRFLQQCTSAPLRPVLRGADKPKIPASQGGTGAPPTDKEHIPGPKGPQDVEHETCRECGRGDYRHFSSCSLEPPF